MAARRPNWTSVFGRKQTLNETRCLALIGRLSCHSCAMVPGAGVEPALPYGKRILSPQCANLLPLDTRLNKGSAC